MNSNDKMNFDSVEKICDEKVQKLLEETVPGSQGTVMYLKLMKTVLDSFLMKDLKVEERIAKIWYCVFFLRIWRHWIKKSHHTLKNFITINAYLCIEINAHSLILLALKCSAEPQLFVPWLTSSQPCEKTFRSLRSLSSTFSTVVNFSMLDILQRINKLQTINEVTTNLGKNYII